MLNNFNFGKIFGKGPFRADHVQIHDGGWLGTIALVIGFMVFNTVEWSVVGMALIHILLALHVLKEHRALYGDADIWTKRLMLAGAWIGSIFLVIIMPIVAIVNYANYARDIRKEYSDKEYQIAWKAYMRILSLVGGGIFIYVIQLTFAAQLATSGANGGL